MLSLELIKNGREEERKRKLLKRSLVGWFCFCGRGKSRGKFDLVSFQSSWVARIMHKPSSLTNTNVSVILQGLAPKQRMGKVNIGININFIGIPSARNNDLDNNVNAFARSAYRMAYQVNRDFWKWFAKNKLDKKTPQKAEDLRFLLSESILSCSALVMVVDCLRTWPCRVASTPDSPRGRGAPFHPSPKIQKH